MASFDELESAWTDGPALPMDRGRVHLVVVRKGNGAHETPSQVDVTVDGGLAGDRWADGDEPIVDAQVTMMSLRAAELVTDGRQPLHMPGDNLLVDLDVSERALPVGTRLRVGTAVLVVTAEPHAGCKKFRERFGEGALRWVNWKAHRARRLRGVNCRVVESGSISVGDSVERLPAPAAASNV